VCQLEVQEQVGAMIDRFSDEVSLFALLLCT
jgi:hypothetical protein